MAALLSPEELENHRLAAELIRLRLRVPIVNYLTQIHHKPLRARWHAIHHESPPNGKLPESVRSFISNPQSLAELSTFVAMYDRLDGEGGAKVTAAMLLRAWHMHRRVAHRELEINAAYYAIRDVRAKIVEWRRCGHCQASFIYDVNAAMARACPFCALSALSNQP